MPEAESTQKGNLTKIAVLAHEADEAKASERAALCDRDSAVVAAVRAGARLDEIAHAAGITKAAASAIARKSLGPRPRRGGPYGRRRGSEVALAGIGETAQRVRDAARHRRQVVAERDAAILDAVAAGLAVRSISLEIKMEPRVVHNLIRRRRLEATRKQTGALASPVASEEGLSPLFDRRRHADLG